MLKFFRIVFGLSGDKTAIPDAVDSNGYVSYTQGYGPDYARQKTDPLSKNIERDRMNQLFYDITNAIAELQANGAPDFITPALNGGTAYPYAQNAMAKYSGAVYLSLVGSNTALPSDTTKWALLPTAALLQQASFMSANAGGTVDAITAAFVPAISALPAAPSTLSLFVRAAGANLTATPTFKADGTAPKTIVKGANQALVAGDIAGPAHWLELQYDATLDKYVLQNPAYGVSITPRPQIQSVAASVAANALTLTFNGGVLDFRNPSLTNGTPISGVAVPSNSITIPSGATLGTVSGQQARLVLIEAYNGGSPVACVANLAGGVNLDEMTLISPTTISAGATSASTIYSASAVSANSPFRVVACVDILEATAGTWAPAPTTVQGEGGQALASLQSFGYGQTIQDLTGSRAAGTTYYNTTGKMIKVAANLNITGGSFGGTITVDGIVTASSTTTSSIQTTLYAEVPPGKSYVIAVNTGTITRWIELR